MGLAVPINKKIGQRRLTSYNYPDGFPLIGGHIDLLTGNLQRSGDVDSLEAMSWRESGTRSTGEGLARQSCVEGSPSKKSQTYLITGKSTTQQQSSSRPLTCLIE